MMLDLSPADQDAILHVHDRWIDAEREGRSLDVLDLCTADVTWMVAGRELLVGTAAARALLESAAAEILELETSEVRIQGSGTMAFKTSRYRSRYRTLDAGPEQVGQGQHLWILRKEADEQWRVAFVTWHETG